MHGAEVYPSVSGMGLGRYNPVLIHSPAAYHCACIVYIQIRRKMACGVDGIPFIIEGRIILVLS